MYFKIATKYCKRKVLLNRKINSIQLVHLKRKKNIIISTIKTIKRIKCLIKDKRYSNVIIYTVKPQIKIPNKNN